jgi:hypothetical protein
MVSVMRFNLATTHTSALCTVTPSCVKTLLTRSCVVRAACNRRAYRLMQRQHFRGGNGDAVRRKIFVASEIGACADKLSRSVQKRADSIDALFAEFDKGLEYSRR